MTVAQFAAAQSDDDDDMDVDDADFILDARKIMTAHAHTETEIRLRMDHTAVHPTDERKTVSAMAQSLARTLEEETNWMHWIYSFLIQQTEEGYFSPADKFYEKIDFFSKFTLH